MKNDYWLLSVIILVLITHSELSFAQKNTQAMRTVFHIISDESELPVIDGDLNEGVWKEAPIIDDFHQSRPTDHGVPSERTEVQVARSDEYIYIGFKAFDSDVKNISAKGFIQGQSFFSDDRVGINIDTFNDRRNSYFFQINANAIRRDALVGNDYFIEDWSTIWYANTQLHEWGWSGEMAIPIKSIAFDPQADEWGFNIGRVHPRQGEEMNWSSRERSSSPSVAGYIQNVQGFDQGLGLEFSPSVSLSYLDSENEGHTSNVTPSLTTFYNMTPFLTAGVTLNTDFSATDVDDRQVNLNRFSLFFPEKRDFFLRDASIFEFGNIDRNGRPFFSRKIGLSSEGEPLGIDAGVKLSGRAGSWNLGALAIRQKAEVDGADQNLFVGRATRNVLSESEFGIIATSGDPTSIDGNSVVGGDFTYRNSQFLGNQQLRANVWYQASETDGFNDNQSAYGVGVNLPNFKYSGFLDYRRVEANFNPALGFVNRVGVEQIDGQARYRHRLDHGYWQWIGSRVQYFKSDRIDGGVQSERTFFNVVEGFSGKNDFFTVFVGRTTEGIIEPFELRDDVTIAVGQYDSNRYGFYIESGPQQAVRFKLEIAGGGFFGGRRFEVNPRIDWRPNKHVTVSLSSQENRISLPQTNESPANEFTSRLYSARFNYAFDSRWAWLNVVQADNFSNTVSINSRIRFQPRADKEYFLVANQTRDRVTNEVIDTALIFKAALNFRL